MRIERGFSYGQTCWVLKSFKEASLLRGFGSCLLSLVLLDARILFDFL